MVNSPLYPWQKDDYKRLCDLGDKLPQSLLLSAPDNQGMESFAYNLAKHLLCLEGSSSGPSCFCKSCQLFALTNHPDFYELTPNKEEDKKIINVDDVRRMVDFVVTSPNFAAKKIVLLTNSNLLNLNSANALLKTLEEPPHYAIFIILSNNCEQILPTIRSRCFKYTLAPPSIEAAEMFLQQDGGGIDEFWLRFYNNSPLVKPELNDEQLELLLKTLITPSVENIYELIEEVDGKKISFGFFLDFLSKWLSDIINLRLNAKVNYFANFTKKIEHLLEKLELFKAFYLSDQISILLPWKNHPLNYKLQIENLLLQYQQIYTKSK